MGINSTKFVLTISLLTFALLQGCKSEHDPVIEIQDPVKEALQKNRPIYFSAVKDYLFSAHCLKCHSQYADYNAVKLELEAVADSINSNRMPRGYQLSEDLKQLFNKWYTAGAPFDKEVAQPEEPIYLANWEGVKNFIFTPHCISCHNPNGQVKFVNLSTYQDIIAQKDDLFDLENPLNSYVISLILDDDEPMPPKDSKVKRLNQTQIALLKKWIALGLPE